MRRAVLHALGEYALLFAVSVLFWYALLGWLGLFD